MNDFEIQVLEYASPSEATEGVNDFIHDCNNEGLEILDMTSHMTVSEDSYYSYTFIFKLKEIDS